LGKQPAKPGGVGEFRGPALGGVASHHTHQLGSCERAVVQQLVQGIADRVVVQGCGEGGVQAGPLPGQDAPLVDLCVEGGLVLC
jgi:hypothetical protein